MICCHASTASSTLTYNKFILLVKPEFCWEQLMRTIKSPAFNMPLFNPIFIANRVRFAMSLDQTGSTGSATHKRRNSSIQSDAGTPCLAITFAHVYFQNAIWNSKKKKHVYLRILSKILCNTIIILHNLIILLNFFFLSTIQRNSFRQKE